MDRWDGKVYYMANFLLFLFIFLIITKSSLLDEIRWSVCISKSQRIMCLILTNVFLLEHIPFCNIVKFKFLAQFPVISFPSQSCLVLYSFWTSLLYSLIIRLIFSSLSPRNLHFLFCCIVSIFALTKLVSIVLFCDAIRSDSVFLIKFPFLNHVQVLSCEISSVCRLKYPCFSSYFCFLIVVLLYWS